MSITFGFFTDSGLTTPFSGLYQLTNNTDLSDNPQDFTLYFGSNASSTKLQASSNPGVDNITLTPTDIEQDWVINTAYSLGDIVEPVIDNGYIFKCTTAGTSDPATEPSWPTSVNSTVADNTVVWTCYAPRHPVTEIKLALTGGAGLTAATGGVALSLGATILSGVPGLVVVHMRITNTVTQVNTNVGLPQIGVNINQVQEVAQ